MPLIKSAKKKLRQDKKRTLKNLNYEDNYKKAIKKIKKEKDKKLIGKVFSTIDKAAKKKIIHKNKANRLKSEVTKWLVKK